MREKLFNQDRNIKHLIKYTEIATAGITLILFINKLRHQSNINYAVHGQLPHFKTWYPSNTIEKFVYCVER